MPLTPLAYVCVVSLFNLPEFEACLARRPSDVLLVISDNPAFFDHAIRLQKRLEQHLPTITVHLLHSSTTKIQLTGDDLIQGQAWAQKVLTPYLNQLTKQGRSAVFNFTGGTKALALALLHGHPWAAVDYCAQGKATLQTAALVTHNNSRLVFDAAPPIDLPDISPLDVAMLQADCVTQAQENELIDQHPILTAALAEDIWQALSKEDPALESLFNRLEWLWTHSPSTQGRALLRLSWEDFLNAQPNAAQLHWLQRIASLAPEALNWDTQHINLPSPKGQKQQRALREWISGTWLEQLAYQWLLKAGLAKHALACNVKSGAQGHSNHSEREADILIHHRNNTFLLEAKADIPEQGKPADIVRQVQSIGDRFGRTHKLLLVGPQLKRRLTPHWEDFQQRCHTSGITLCSNAESLLKSLNLAPPNETQSTGSNTSN